eukprot:5791110-Lingulodinium_polyedra.AAC.1
MIEVGSDDDGLGGTSEPEKEDGISEAGEEDDDELGEDFDQTYSHVMNALERLEQQAENIGRRA